MKSARILSAVSIAVATLVLIGASLSPALAESAGSAQATSSIVLGEQDGAKTVEIRNVTFSTAGSHVPGRPEEERLLLRTTTHSREVIDEKGLEATVAVEAWPLGTDLAAKPLYTVNLDGVGATVEDSSLLVIDRGTEDVAWWSVHGLGTGAPLFDTFVPLLRLSISRDVRTLRYVGFDVPPDDTRDERLRDPKVVGVLAYASPERVIRQLLVTCSDPQHAALLRSYWDTKRALSFMQPPDKLGIILMWWDATNASAPDGVSIPLAGDDLDTANAKLPACMALTSWSP
jgi:hypothetical protein